MRISDWSSDVCSSDLQPRRLAAGRTQNRARRKCARGAGPRATGGGAGRHRLRNRGAGDEGRRGGGHVPRRNPFQDQLSARDPPHRQPPGRGTIQGLSSVASGQGRFRAIWIRREVTIWPLAPEEIETLRLSLKVSLAATAAILPIAFALAYVLARDRKSGVKGKSVSVRVGSGGRRIIKKKKNNKKK